MKLDMCRHATFSRVYRRGRDLATPKGTAGNATSRERIQASGGRCVGCVKHSCEHHHRALVRSSDAFVSRRLTILKWLSHVRVRVCFLYMHIILLSYLPAARVSRTTQRTSSAGSCDEVPRVFHSLRERRPSCH